MWFLLLSSIVACVYLFAFLDYTKGFGGKYGLEEDRQDKSAVGWDDHEKLHQHESQTGSFYQVFRDNSKSEVIL